MTDTIFQLPDAALMNRFLPQYDFFNLLPSKKFGQVLGNFTTLPSQHTQRYYTNVLFAT